MFFHQRFIPGLAIYSYMIGNEKTKEAAVIDPTRDVDEFVQIAEREGLYIKHILETHVHADFVSGSRELKVRLYDEPTIHSSGMGGLEWIPNHADHVMKDGEEIRMGDIRLKAFHTPGHTLEHFSWLLFDDSRSKEVPWLVFTGDFLFVGDVGRPDLLGREAQTILAHQLYESVFQKLPGLPDFTEIFPGHGAGSLCGKAIGSRASSTMGYERRFNAALVEKLEEQWVGDLLSGMPIAPPYFKRMKRINVTGAKILGPELPGQQRVSAKSVHERVCEKCLVVDVRPMEAFSAAHIPGAINIPFGPNLPTWAGWVLPYDRPTLIVPGNPSQIPEVVRHLTRVGFDDIRGWLDGGMEAWEMKGYDVVTVPTLSVHDLSKELKAGRKQTVLDVRTEKEWTGGHIDGAIHVHGGTLEDHYARIPRDLPVTVVCGSGYRATIAASFLQREGFTDVRNVIGGMSAWVNSHLPVSRN